MANPQNTNPNARTNQSSQGSQQNASSQSGQQNAGTQGQWSNQDLYGNQDFGGYGAGFGGQGMGMYDPNTWGMGNMAGGPYSGPNQGYGANWYGAPQYAGLGPLGYPTGGYGGYGYGNQGFGGYGPGMGLGTPQYADLGGWGAPATATVTEWWLIPGPATGMGPQNAQRSDQRIEEDVCDRLTAHGHLDARHIDVKVNNGEVTLSGTVDSRQDKREAEHVADSIQGIKDVHNQLKVQQQGQSQQGQSQQGQQGQTRQQQQAKTR